MENLDVIIQYIKPELLLLIPVLYMIGNMLKNIDIFPDKWIPLTLGIIGIILATLYILATSTIDNYQSVIMLIFTAITQGILVSGCSVYFNQIVKQLNKSE
jgi:uncharacterized membrane protein